MATAPSDQSSGNQKNDQLQTNKEALTQHVSEASPYRFGGNPLPDNVQHLDISIPDSSNRVSATTGNAERSTELNFTRAIESTRKVPRLLAKSTEEVWLEAEMTKNDSRVQLKDLRNLFGNDLIKYGKICGISQSNIEVDRVNLFRRMHQYYDTGRFRSDRTITYDKIVREISETRRDHGLPSITSLGYSAVLFRAVLKAFTLGRLEMTREVSGKQRAIARVNQKISETVSDELVLWVRLARCAYNLHVSKSKQKDGRETVDATETNYQPGNIWTPELQQNFEEAASYAKSIAVDIIREDGFQLVHRKMRKLLGYERRSEVGFQIPNQWVSASGLTTVKSARVTGSTEEIWRTYEDLGMAEDLVNIITYSFLSIRNTHDIMPPPKEMMKMMFFITGRLVEAIDVPQQSERSSKSLAFDPDEKMILEVAPSLPGNVTFPGPNPSHRNFLVSNMSMLDPINYQNFQVMARNAKRFTTLFNNAGVLRVFHNKEEHIAHLKELWHSTTSRVFPSPPHLSVRQNREGDLLLDGLSDPLPPPEYLNGCRQYKNSIECDHCGSPIWDHEHHFRCDICNAQSTSNNGNFDICQTCVNKGMQCSENSHKLVERTIRFGVMVDIEPSASTIDSCGASKQYVRDSSGQQWQDAPLGISLEHYFQLVDIADHPLAEEIGLAESIFRGSILHGSELTQSASGILRSWAQICLVLQLDTLSPTFKSTLSPIQLGSIKILHEWWLSEIQDVDLTAMAVYSFVIGSIFPDLSPEFQVPLAKTNESAYHSTLWDLFVAEFSPIARPRQDTGYAPTLSFIRNAAAVASCVQRIGYLCIHPYLTPTWLENKPQETAQQVILASQILQKKVIALATPMLMLWHSQPNWQERLLTVSRIACWGPSLLFTANLANAEQILGLKKLSASLSPCPWLSHSEKFSTMPYFLWDVFEEKTVETSTLEVRPKYTAISHTWGRWRVDKEDFDLTGAKWPIPKNSCFDVSQLPEILKDVPGGSRYVWLDLVCIPQENASRELAEITTQEIARQAAIFNNAQHVIAWFSNLESFGPLDSAIGLLAQSLVEYPDLTIRSPGIAGRSIDITKPQYISLIEINESNFQASFHGWFTSLWTLQEACMRPDMWLCTRDWKSVNLPLGFNRLGYPVCFDGLLALIDHSWDKGGMSRSTQPLETRTDEFSPLKWRLRKGNKLGGRRFGKQTPPALKNFVAAFAGLNLHKILYIRPMEILFFGDRRVCTSRRAEAIMSAMGISEWYAKHRDSTDLILQRYPNAFIQEVRQKLGDGEFFDFDIADYSVIEIVRSVSDPLTSLPVPFGSLLPFGKNDQAGLGFTAPNPGEGLADIQSHYTLASWQINLNGSVRITSASILASSEYTHSTCTMPHFAIVDDVFDQFHAAQQLSGQEGLILTPRRITDLTEWIKTRDYRCYAVCYRLKTFLTYRDQESPWVSTGVLLRELRRGYLLKVGQFSTFKFGERDHVFPPATEVDWIVL